MLVSVGVYGSSMRRRQWWIDEFREAEVIVEVAGEGRGGGDGGWTGQQ